MGCLALLPRNAAVWPPSEASCQLLVSFSAPSHGSLTIHHAVEKVYHHHLVKIESNVMSIQANWAEVSLQGSIQL